MSDGDAEDTSAYPLNDVLKYAKKHKIHISALAYLDTIVVQNLRKLSEDTGGKLWIANKTTHKFNKSFQKSFYQYIDSEFIVKIPKSMLSPSYSGEQVVNLMFSKNRPDQNLSVSLPTKKIIIELSFWEKYKLYILISIGILILLFLFLLLKPKKEEVVDEYAETEDITSISIDPLVLTRVNNSATEYKEDDTFNYR